MNLEENIPFKDEPSNAADQNFENGEIHYDSDEYSSDSRKKIGVKDNFIDNQPKSDIDVQDEFKYVNNLDSCLEMNSLSNCENVNEYNSQASEENIEDRRSSNNESDFDSQNATNDADEQSQTEDVLGDNSPLLADNTFSCSLCSFTTDKQRALNDHERNHRRYPSPIVQCYYCSQRYTRLKLSSHIQNVHPGQTFQIREPSNSKILFTCPKCNFSTTESVHFQLHKKENCLEAGNANMETSSGRKNDDIDKSLGDIEGIPSLENTDRSLLKVDKPFLKSTRNSLSEAERNLVQTNATNRRKFACTMCSYASVRLDHLNRHIKSHRKKTLIEKCSKCNFKSTPSALIFHMRKCSEQKIHRTQPMKSRKRNLQLTADVSKKHMNECNQNNSNSSAPKNNGTANLTLDNGNQGSIKVYKCEKCSFSTVERFKYSRHMQSHARKEPIQKCNMCSYKSTPGSLKRHMQKEGHLNLHSRETNTVALPEKNYSNITEKHKTVKKPYISAFKCTKCSLVCTKPYTFTKHMKSHSNNLRIKQCSHCNFRSTPRPFARHSCYRKKKEDQLVESADNSKISAHFKNNGTANLTLDNGNQTVTAGSTKVYKCEKCSFSTVERFKYSRHMQSHARKEPIQKCNMCSYKSTPGSLKRHMQKEGHLNLHSRETNTVALPKKNYSNITEKHKTVKKPYISAFKCTKCSLVCTKPYTFTKHMKSHSNNLRIKQCSHCNFRSTPRPFARHSCYRKKKEDQLVESADNSKISAHFKNNGTANLTLDNGNQTVTAGSTKVYKCEKCSFSTVNPFKYSRHMQSHARKESIQKCNMCSYESTPGSLKRHMQKEGHLNLHSRETNTVALPEKNYSDITEKHKTVKKPYISAFKCTKCSLVCTKPYTFTTHMKSHSNNLRIKQCSHCNFRSTPRPFARHSCSRKKKEDQLEESADNSKNSAHFKNNETANLTLDYGNQTVKAVSTKFYKCEKCSFSTVNPFKYSRHMQSHARKEPIQKCNMCSYESTSGSLKRHMQKEGHLNLHSRETNTVALPEKNYSNITEKHKTVKKPYIRAFKCTKCSLVCTKPYTFTKHMKSHSNNLRIKQCSHCNFRSTPRPFARHSCSRKKKEDQLEESADNSKNSAHFENNGTDNLTLNNGNKIVPAGSTKVFKCNICSFSTFVSSEYGIHMKNHVKQEPIKKCNMYSYESTPGSLLWHMQKEGHLNSHSVEKNTTSLPEKNHSNVPEKRKVVKKPYVRTLKCKQCSLVCTKLYTFQKHMESHLHNLPIKQCPYCDFRSTPKPLERHSCSRKKKEDQLEESVDNSKNSAQSKNNETANLTLDNGNKIVTAGSTKVYKCTICSFSTFVRFKYSRHMQSHVRKELIKKCNMCSYESTPGNLLRHMQMEGHLNTDSVKIKKSFVKTHKCKQCSLVCTSPYTLKKHTTSHLLKLPIKQCLYCDFRSTPTALGRHFCTKKSDRYKEDHPKEAAEALVDNIGCNANPDVSTTSKVCDITTYQASAKKYAFNCSQCSFSTSLRIILNFHMQKCHQKLSTKLVTKSNSLKFHARNCKGTRHASKNNEETFRVGLNSRIESVNVEAKQYSSCSRVEDHSVQETAALSTNSCTTLYKDNLKRHEMTNLQAGNTVYKCSICDFFSIHKANLKRHMVLHSEKPVKKYRCSTCSYYSLYKSNLERHMHLHKASEVVSSPNQLTLGQSKSIQSNGEIARKNQNRPIVPDKEEEVFMIAPGIYGCTICSYSSEMRRRIRFHQESHRRNLPIKQCPNCDYRSTPRALSHHVLNCANPTEPDDATTSQIDSDVSKVYKCNVCSYTAHLDSALRRHVNNHLISNIPVKQCTNCDFKGTRSVLEKHGPKCPNKTTDKILRKCSECSYSTYLPKRLKDHKEKNHPRKKEIDNKISKMVKCQYCSYTTLLPYLLERHMSSHLKKLPIEKCSNCDYQSTPAALTIHTKACAGASRDKPYDVFSNSSTSTIAKESSTIANRPELESAITGFCSPKRNEVSRPEIDFSSVETGEIAENITHQQSTIAMDEARGESSISNSCSIESNENGSDRDSREEGESNLNSDKSQDAHFQMREFFENNNIKRKMKGANHDVAEISQMDSHSVTTDENEKEVSDEESIITANEPITDVFSSKTNEVSGYESSIIAEESTITTNEPELESHITEESSITVNEPGPESCVTDFCSPQRSEVSSGYESSIITDVSSIATNEPEPESPTRDVCSPKRNEVRSYESSITEESRITANEPEPESCMTDFCLPKRNNVSGYESSIIKEVSRSEIDFCSVETGEIREKISHQQSSRAMDEPVLDNSCSTESNENRCDIGSREECESNTSNDESQDGYFSLNEFFENNNKNKLSAKSSDKTLSDNNLNTLKTSSDSCKPKLIFKCPECPFVSLLRIKLKIHQQKDH